MNETLASPYFKEFIIPLIAVVITIAVKVVSRRDAFIDITRDDFAIGFDLIISSILLLVTYSSGIAAQLHQNIAHDPELCKKKLENLPWILFVAIFGLWSLSTLVRLYGWEKNQNKILTIGIGIIIPALIGIVSLLVTVNYIE